MIYIFYEYSLGLKGQLIYEFTADNKFLGEILIKLSQQQV